MAFHELLTDSLTKECGGRHGGKGHEFQRYWALCHLLKLDLEQADYVVLMEYIEDVAVLNTENQPTELHLYQIKKKEGTPKWTTASLTTQPKKGLSILAKLYESKKFLRNSNSPISFVSNAPVDLKLLADPASTERIQFCAEEIEVKLRSSLRSSIASQLKCPEQDISFETLHFIKSPLAMDDLKNHAIGCVSSYLGQKSPTHGGRADIFCEALYGEITIRATATQQAASFEELRNIRGITKSQFSLMLSVTLARKPDSEIIEEAIRSLTQEKVAFNLRDKIKLASRRFLIDRVGKCSDVLIRLEQAIDDYYGIIPDELVSSWDVANWIADEITLSAQSTAYLMLDREYLLAAILYRIYQ